MIMVIMIKLERSRAGKREKLGCLGLQKGLILSQALQNSPDLVGSVRSRGASCDWERDVTIGRLTGKGSD